MIIIISPMHVVKDEAAWVHAFFQHGLDFFHVRKYSFSDHQMEGYLHEMEPAVRAKLVLHSHHHLADDYGIRRLHIREAARVGKMPVFSGDYLLSTSVHAIDDFNALDASWQYAFLSPVFQSISKVGYGRQDTVLRDLKKKNNPRVRLIGLGGVDQHNCKQVVGYGADGFALLGSVWQSENPLKAFLTCQ